MALYGREAAGIKGFSGKYREVADSGKRVGK